jgi:hypothetical protein
MPINKNNLECYVVAYTLALNLQNGLRERSCNAVVSIVHTKVREKG